MKAELMQKINDRTLTVAVIGLGYVGLPLAVEKAKAGFKTIGFDIQSQKVDMVSCGENYISDVADEDLQELVSSGMLCATSDYSFLGEADFIAICVPTPIDIHKQPDISYVRESAKAVAPYLKRGTVVVLESTTYPGTTEELLKPILEEGSNLTCGKDFYLGFSPERVDPGNQLYKTKNTPKIVSAIGKDALEVISAVYRAVLDGDVFEASSPVVAEMEKLLENTYRNVNIALVNELALLCDKMEINVWEVIDAAKTKPYGFQAFYPGPGVGGHCIPLDPYYLSWKAREFGFHVTMIESAAMINDRMPEYCADRISRILNKSKKALNEANALILGVAYKQDIDDYRESPALALIAELAKRGARVDYYDPFVKNYTYKGASAQSIGGINIDILRKYDIIAVATSHTMVDYDMVATAGVPVLDMKNAMKHVAVRDIIEVL